MGCCCSKWKKCFRRNNRQTRSDLEQNEEEKSVYERSALRENEKLKSDIERLTKTNTSLENELRQMKSNLEHKEEKSVYERSALRENENLKSDIKRLTDLKISQEKEIQKIRSDLEEKEEQLKSATDKSTLSQKEKKVKSLTQSLSDMDKNLIEAKAALRRKQQELTSFKDRMAGQLFVSKPTAETDDLHKQKLEETICELKQKEEELKSLKQRLQESADVRSSPQHCNPQGCEHKESMTQMEAFYKKKLNEARSETAKKQTELKSVKDRLAAQVAASLKTGDTESMNNPVSKTRLTEMYDNLKLLQWPKVKDQLKSRKRNPKEAKDLIQKTFGNASDEMKRRRQQIEEMFQQSESSSGPTPQKVKEYRQLTVQNLQMALFHTNKEELLKTGFPECLDEFPEEVKEDLRPLTSECYWLSCLMALNNPPLQPDWKNHVPGFDSWDIFPREIKPSVM